MATQLLVNVLNVGPIAPLGSVVVPHGLKVAGAGVTPTQVLCDRASPLSVSNADATNLFIVNLSSTVAATAKFRAEFDHSIHAVGAPLIAWKGYVTPTTLPPSGPAGGDLDQTYPNPRVVGFASQPIDTTTPVANEYWKFDGAVWRHTPVTPGTPAAIYGSYSLNAASTTVPVTPAAPLAVPFDVVEGEAGVSLVGGTKFTVADAGIYEVALSPQLVHSGGAASVISMWLRQNGTGPVVRSNSDVRLANNGDTLFLYIAIVLPLAAGDFVEWMMQSSGNGPTTMTTFAGTGAGANARPVAPAVIASIKRIGS